MFSLEDGDQKQFQHVRDTYSASDHVDNVDAVLRMRASEAHINAYNTASRYLRESSSVGVTLNLDDPAHSHLLGMSLRLYQKDTDTFKEKCTREERLVLAQLYQSSSYVAKGEAQARQDAGTIGQHIFDLFGLVPGIGWSGSAFCTIAAAYLGRGEPGADYVGMSHHDLRHFFKEEELSDRDFANTLLSKIAFEADAQKEVASNVALPAAIIEAVDAERKAFEIQRVETMRDLHGSGAGAGASAAAAAAMLSPEDLSREHPELQALLVEFKVDLDEALLRQLSNPRTRDALLKNLKALKQVKQTEQRLQYSQAGADACGFLAGLGELTRSKPLMVAGQTGQQLFEIAQIFYKIPEDLSGIALVSPYALIGQCVLKIISLFRSQGDDPNELILASLQIIGEQIRELHDEVRQQALGIHEHLNAVFTRLLAQINLVGNIGTELTVIRLDRLQQDMSELAAFIGDQFEFVHLKKFHEKLTGIDNIYRGIERSPAAKELAGVLLVLQTYLSESYADIATGARLSTLPSDRQRFTALGGGASRDTRTALPAVINFLLCNVMKLDQQGVAPNTHLWIGYLAAYLCVRPMHQLQAAGYDPELRLLQTERVKAETALTHINSLVTTTGQARLHTLKDSGIAAFGALQESLTVLSANAEQTALPGFTAGGDHAAELAAIIADQPDAITALVPHANCQISMEVFDTERSLQERRARWASDAENNHVLFALRPTRDARQRPKKGKASKKRKPLKNKERGDWHVYWKQPTGAIVETILEPKNSRRFCRLLDRALKHFSGGTASAAASAQDGLTGFFDPQVRDLLLSLWPTTFTYEYAPGKRSKEFGNRFHSVYQHVSLETLITANAGRDVPIFSPLLLYALQHNMVRFSVRMYQSFANGGRQVWVTSGGARYGVEITCVVDGEPFILTQPKNGYAKWQDAKRNAAEKTHLSHVAAIPDWTVVDRDRMEALEIVLRQKISAPHQTVNLAFIRDLHQHMFADDSPLITTLLHLQYGQRIGELLGISDDVLMQMERISGQLHSFMQALDRTLQAAVASDARVVPVLTVTASELVAVWDAYLTEIASPDFKPQSAYLTQLRTGISWLKEMIAIETDFMQSRRALSADASVRLSGFTHMLFSTFNTSGEVTVEDVHRVQAALSPSAV